MSIYNALTLHYFPCTGNNCLQNHLIATNNLMLNTTTKTADEEKMGATLGIK